MALYGQFNVATNVSTASTASPAYILNQHETPFNVGFGVTKVSGDATFTVQHTFDNLFVSAANWFDHSSVSGKTASIDGNYAFPIFATRVVLLSGSGAQINFRVRQAG